MLENLKKGYRDIVTKIQEPPHKSQFYEKGILTPQEFVEACDKLKKINPIWKWGEAKTPQYRNKYLPDTKQFLYSDIISRKRLKDDKEEIEVIDKEGFQVIQMKSITKVIELDDNQQIEIKDEEPKEKKPIQIQLESDSEEEPEKIQTKIEEKVEQKNVDKDLRNYRVYITYDLYYHTPRFWLNGLDYKNEPLNKEQIFEDVMGEYVNKTATEEMHPQLQVPMVFIHPCKHADVVKKFTSDAIKNGKDIQVEQYMFVFMKFITSVVPNLEMDFTTEIEFQLSIVEYFQFQPKSKKVFLELCLFK